MLVLGRRVGEQIVARVESLEGNPLKEPLEIVVKVISARGGKVSIGIDAPSSVVIMREEIAGEEFA